MYSGIGHLIAQLRAERDLSQAQLAQLLAEASGNPAVTRNKISRWEQGRRRPRRYWLQWLAVVFGLSLADLDDLVRIASPTTDTNEAEAIELGQRVAASDVGGRTLEQLELAVDELAIAYPRVQPDLLLLRVRRHLTYVGKLLDARKTLAEHRRLVVTGSWLSLLAATCSIDLADRPAAAARLRTAAQLAEHADHPELSGWALETEAWQAVTDGDYRRAIKLSQAAQAAAPVGSSAFIQATAQEGRAHARLGHTRDTLEVLSRVEHLVAPLEVPDQPEHHYRYDPGKSDAYVATTLSWLGDPGAVPIARQVLTQLESPAHGAVRPRRAATARLDLSLALVASGEPDEASSTTMEAITSGRLVPSNYWRAREVINAIDAHGVPEVAELRDAYESLKAEGASV
ncbi:transcriptional regulator, XRE family [Kribbella flavida DSM 17836]|uniref:Transcriptional regulator, XRE family n=1 Tax=Kribbella flavida (strain DSM 17836 / JCM 10339 / NBRC 14399) TaxID=479435 RepID=D2PLZ8_KRIFD|nr:helix-turn-helix domain-containing protein [Kribbella flavida]ADB32578.1 transcriptional regulator, XRE family [Kribbella flavida DSM 17836]